MANLIYDSGSITSAVTQVDIDLTSTPIEKGELYELVTTFPEGTGGFTEMFANDVLTSTNYYYQLLQADGTTVSGARGNLAPLRGDFTRTSIKTYIKLTNDGHFVFLNNIISKVGSSTTRLVNYFTTSTTTFSSITKLNIRASVANQILVGTRFQLYKVAEKVDEVIVSGSPVTQVDFTTDIQKGNEYLLVSDYNNTSGSVSKLYLYANDNTTATNYYTQLLFANNTNVGGARENNAHIKNQSNGFKALVVTNIKVANSGYFQSQSNSVGNYGTSSVEIVKNYNSSTFTVTNLTKLNLVAEQSNAIGIGSRFELYKMV